MSAASRNLLAAALLLGATSVAAQRRPVLLLDFERDAVGQPPAGFAFAEMRDAAPKQWSVRREGATQLLVHTGDPASGRGFATAIVDAPPLDEGEVSVRIRLLDGDRAGGLVWRYRDPRNFHMVQFTLGEQSIGLYRVVDGNRVRLELEDDLELDPLAWHTLKVVQRRRSVRVYLGGIRVFEDRDRTDDTGGGVGVWCGGNSTAQFDDLRVSPGEGRP